MDIRRKRHFTDLVDDVVEIALVGELDDTAAEIGPARQMKDKIITLLEDWKERQPPELAKPDKKMDMTIWASIIKLPFWELTAKNENVFYACLNREASHSPEHLRGRSLYLQGDLAETLAALRQERSIAATIK